MKKYIKILSVILLLVLTMTLLPLKVFATGDINPLPVEEQTNNTVNSGVVNETTDLTKSGDNTEVTTLGEDKNIAKDKNLPDAGFDRNMIYIISALVVIAVFAYIKVVKYNVD